MVLVRALALIVFTMIPPSLAGWILWGVPGLAGGALLAYLLLIYIAFASERIVIRAIVGRGRGKTKGPGSVALEVPPGLAFSLDQVLARLSSLKLLENPRLSEAELLRPALQVYADPLPNAFIVRSFAGTGSLILSRGLLEQLDEEELRAVLATCLLRNQQGDWPFRSLCSALATSSLRWAPLSWKEFFLAGSQGGTRGRARLTPVGIAAFAVFLPVNRLLSALAGLIRLSPAEIARASHYRPDIIDSAARKIQGAAQLAGWRPYIGTELLAVVDPRPGSRLL